MVGGGVVVRFFACSLFFVALKFFRRTSHHISPHRGEAGVRMRLR